MSDIQDLIHKTTMDCIERGKQQEQARIIELLLTWGMENLSCQSKYEDLVQLIKGQK